jgi:phage shock protein C
MAVKKRLFKSKKNKVLAGVFGGLGEYFDIDPTILRLAWLLVVVFTAVVPGTIAYIVAAIIMPQKQG